MTSGVYNFGAIHTEIIQLELCLMDPLDHLGNVGLLDGTVAGMMKLIATGSFPDSFP